MGVIKFFYPNGNILKPTTGGEIYDSKLYQAFSFYNKFKVIVITCKLNRISILKRFFNVYKDSISKDIIIFNSRISVSILPILILNKIIGRKTIIAIHHHFAYQEMIGFRRRIMKNIERLSLSLCRMVISPNPYVIDNVKLLCPSVKIKFIGHPFLHQNKDRSSYNKYNLLYVGTVYPRKGLDLLIEAISKLPDSIKRKIDLNIVGNIIDLKYYNQIYALVKKYGIEDIIHFKGRVSEDELEKMYLTSYCFILPSKHEGYGLVIEEAMSYGLPVIGFNNSAIPYTLKDNVNGILVNNMDTSSMANAIERILGEEQFHWKLSEGALASYKKSHDVSDFEQEVKELIFEFISNNEKSNKEGNETNS